MNTIKKIMGALCLLIAMLVAYFSISVIGLPKFMSGLGGNQSDMVFGIIVLFILTPIIVGALVVFGIYAIKGEYSQ